jgi:ABC-2 type transport system ATP-binding protein
MTQSESRRPPLLSVRQLSKSYGSVRALQDVAFFVRPGEILGLLGPNGAGKTTLFECLAGVQAADSGQLRFDDARARREDLLFYLPDAIAPWPDQSVSWVLRYVVGAFRGRDDLRGEIVERLGLEPLMRARVRSLSKGQRKRVLLATGMLTPQSLLLIDEPFEGLDLRQGREVAQTLRWHVSHGRTLFLSIHQIGHAARFCDRFVLLSGGRVCAEGTQEELAVLAAERAGGAAAGAPGPQDFEEVFLALT